jgi:mannosyltransferase OCH1-like enzyme
VIPKRLVRTVPEVINHEQERLWRVACELHPGWEHITLRDPVDRKDFPLTSHAWDSCEAGSALANLIRAEDLYHNGGVYIDSDVEVYRPFDSLLGCEAFAAWEDPSYIPNAVMGCRPHHPAMREVAIRAAGEIPCKPWFSGVRITTEVFVDRDDVTLLPPACFYPWHWRQRDISDADKAEIRAANPWSFAAHHWAASWWAK